MNGKELCAAYAKELESESIATRKCLERIPENVFDFKPHEKSMAMGYLTLLVAEIPKWIWDMIESSVIDFATYKHIQPGPADRLVAQYDECVAGAIKALNNITDEQLKKDFELRNSGQLLYSSPMLESISSTINHWVHHRGQLTVYMRLNDIAVPSIYGPSADEKGF